jgi:hypothetical protein
MRPVVGELRLGRGSNEEPTAEILVVVAVAVGVVVEVVVEVVVGVVVGVVVEVVVGVEVEVGGGVEVVVVVGAEQMSTCIRNGVRYKRHEWIEKLSGMICKHCRQFKGGTYEQRNLQGTNAPASAGLQRGDLHEVLRTDGGVQLQPSDSGAGGDSEGIPSS